MKRALLFIFMTVCVLGMSACSSKDAMPETSDSASNPVQNTDISNLNGGKIWSEQDIVSMFSLVQETDERIDEDKTRHISIEIHFNLKPIPEVEQVTA